MGLSAQDPSTPVFRKQGHGGRLSALGLWWVCAHQSPVTGVLGPTTHILLEDLACSWDFSSSHCTGSQGGTAESSQEETQVSTIKVSNRGTKNNRITTQDWGREVGVKHTIYHSRKAIDNGRPAKSIYVSILGREMEVPTRFENTNDHKWVFFGSRGEREGFAFHQKCVCSIWFFFLAVLYFI